jgi:CRP/FNR family transcriptional regulator, cyclic AMP receptor protein
MRFRSGKGARGEVEQLRGVELFDGLSDDDLAQVARLGERVSAEAGAVLMDQGAVGTECFVIIEGTAAVHHGETRLATDGPGTIVGEMALIGHRPRTARVVAETPMQLLCFDIGHFKALLERLPAARERILGILHARAEANRALDEG